MALNGGGWYYLAFENVCTVVHMVKCLYCTDTAQFQVALKINGTSNQFSYTELYVCLYHKGEVTINELLQSSAWRNMVQEAVDAKVKLPSTLTVEADYYRLRTPELPYAD